MRTTLPNYYNTFKTHAQELFGGKYGHELVEVWLDGGYPPELETFIADLVDQHQPNAIIFQAPNWNRSLHSGNAVRWAGTETGHTPSADMWSTVHSKDEGEGGDYAYGQGAANGDVFMPSEQHGAIQTKAASSTEGKMQNRLVSFYPSTRTASVTTVITCLNFRPIVKVPCQWAMCWRTLGLERPLTSVTVLVMGTVLSHMLTTSSVTVAYSATACVSQQLFTVFLWFCRRPHPNQRSRRYTLCARI